LAGPVGLQGFQAVARRRAQRLQCRRGVQHVQLSRNDFRYRAPLSWADAVSEEPFGCSFGKANDHDVQYTIRMALCQTEAEQAFLLRAPIPGSEPGDLALEAPATQPRLQNLLSLGRLLAQSPGEFSALIRQSAVPSPLPLSQPERGSAVAAVTRLFPFSAARPNNRARLRPRDRAGSSARERGLLSRRRAIAGVAERREADQQHRPGRGLRRSRRDEFGLRRPCGNEIEAMR